MKKSKRAKASKLKDEIDRISNLPDDILYLILAGLPSTREVIRTSILSTRWRYMCTSFPYSSIRIRFPRTLKAPSRFKMNKFNEFMSRVLVNESLDLDALSLLCPNYHDMRTLRQWIDAAVTRNVKLIHVLVCPKKKFKAPHSLVNNGSLKVLRLFLFGRPLRFPNCTGLPSLRVVELNNLNVVDTNFREFLNSCPLLEDLSLIDCWLIDGYTWISLPNLKNLRIDNKELDQHMSYYIWIVCPKLVLWEVAGYVYHKFFIHNLDSLEKAVFHPQLFGLSKEEVVAEISNPGDMSLHIFLNHERPDSELDGPLLNPKTLELTTTIDFLTKDTLIGFLMEFPDLGALHLIIIQGPFCPTLYSNLDGCGMEILTDHLKKVEFVDFNGEKENLFVARSLLKHGGVLEEMVFSWGNEIAYFERSMETMKEVSNFHKASSTVKLISLLKN